MLHVLKLLPAKPAMSLLKLIRWSEWYDSKGATFALCVYLSLYWNQQTANTGSTVLLLGVYFIGIASLGHLVNDRGDRQQDLQVAKRKELDAKARQISSLAIVTTALMCFTPLWLSCHWETLALIVISIFLAIGYSLKPFRFKESPLLGPLVAAAAQRVCPAVLAASVIGFRLLMVPWLALFFALGLRMILIHQILDHDNDVQSGTSTLAVRIGLVKTRALVTYLILPLEGVLLLICLRTMVHNPVFLNSLIFYVIVSLIFMIRGKNLIIISYTMSPLVDWYHFFLPLVMTVVLALSAHSLWYLAVFELGWKNRYFRKHYVRYCFASSAPNCVERS